MCLDVGGGTKIRPLWHAKALGAKGIVFFVDSHDHFRIEEAGSELIAMAAHEADGLSQVPILVVANKQDIPQAMGLQEVDERMGLQQLRRGRRVDIIPASITSGQGVAEIEAWLECLQG
jgi:signal recognition particle receptor subunit beta